MSHPKNRMVLRMKKMMKDGVFKLMDDVELPILAFPVVVVMVVAVTFLFPFGRCGLWQWWVPVAAMFALLCV